MTNFEFYCPAKIEFGLHATEKLKSYMDELHIANPVVLVGKRTRQTETVSKVLDSLNLNNIYDTVEPNPSSSTVMRLAAYVEEVKADGIIIFGGGSAIDSAKGASVVAYTGNHVSEYYDFAPNQRPIEKTLPLIAIPTTAGTGSEVSIYAVISEDETGVKKCLTSYNIVPKIAVIDPLMTVGMPASITVSTGLDALSHALESLLSTIENPLTNLLAMPAIKLIFENLNKARLDGNDIDARSNMAYAALLAGIAMSHCCGTMCHAMGCQVTAQYHVPHGLACAVFERYGLDYAGEKAENIRTLVNYLYHEDCTPEEAVKLMQQKLDELFMSLETPMNLKESNMTEEGISIMTKDAMEHGCMGLNPVEMNPEMVSEVYKKLQ